MSNFRKVFEVFKELYQEIPLETFKSSSYKTLISTSLSSRTKDEVTLEASKRLFKKAPRIDDLKSLKEEEIQNLIYPVGFYKTKAKHLKKLATILVDDYNMKVPRTREELMKLPGVGRKTANLVLNRAFGKKAIAVDTHVHRISNMLGWVDTKKPEDTEKQLTNTLPRKYWPDINRLFVSIGRQYTSKKKLKEFLKEKELLN
jgi:endonuclease-3